MANTVELSIDALSDLVVNRWNQFFTEANLVDLGFKGLTGGSIALLKQTDFVSAMKSVLSSPNIGDLAAKLAVPLVGLKLLAVTQIGTSIRISAAHDSASCDAIGSAVFKTTKGVTKGVSVGLISS